MLLKGKKRIFFSSRALYVALSGSSNEQDLLIFVRDFAKFTIYRDKIRQKCTVMEQKASNVCKTDGEVVN